MRNLGKAFVSILVGNLIYFWASPRLPYAMQHQPNHIDYGLGVLRADSFSQWPNNKPFDLADVYCRLLVENRLAGFEVTERFYEIGSPEGLAELDAFLRAKADQKCTQ